MKEDQR